MEARLAALTKAGAKRRKATWEKYRYTKQELLGTLDPVAVQSSVGARDFQNSRNAIFEEL